ncbi:SPRY domain-containing protein 3-like [Ruditapes philippinarum]|uniref:SPRY domain-containing protein 3-like n=1 Tax=Ruditapes philippinarum TaxID=129788 RepID=UPI00295A7B4D|nr:SPRY domain-containing protein 3-like [Ruditapes philippinarum]
MSLILAIGLVPDSYPANMQPGWGHYSIGYHAHDGCLYHQYGRGIQFGPKCRDGDKIGCCIYLELFRRGKNVETVVNAIKTRNGTKVGEKKLSTGPLFNLYPAVGMHSPGEKVKVIFHTGLPASIKRYTKIH